jgi:sterol 3beta-glucosyltransferase
MDRPDFSALVFAVFAPTTAFPCPGFPYWRLGPFYNRLTHQLFIQLFWRGGGMAYGWLRRRDPALPRLSGWPFRRSNERPTPILYGFSPSVIPKPADWGQHVHVTGYWSLDDAPDWEPPAELARFLEAGPPPVFVGFGSVISREARELTEIVVAALSEAGQRGVLLSGWGGLGGADPSGQVCQIETAPFDWLFPRTAAVVHHGGIGTTAAGLRAGVPTVVVPFTADQPFWGRRVHLLGAGPRPIPRKRLTVQNLVEAVRLVVSDETMRGRSRALGERLSAEDGVARAIEVIEGYLGD